MAGRIVDQSTLRTGSGRCFSKGATVGALLVLIAVGLSAMPREAAADTFLLDEFSVTNGVTTFDDSFNRTTTLTPPNPVASGTTFSDGSSANYFVQGTIPETTANNGQAQLNPANGATVTQPDPFIPVIQEVFGTLQTGTTGSHALTSGNTFSVTGLFDLVAPSAVEGTYDILVTNRTQANGGMGRVLELRLRECQPMVGGCGSASGPVLQFAWLDFINNKFTLINQVALTSAELANPQLELQLVKGSATSDVIQALYAFGSGSTLATFNGSLTPLGMTDTTTDVFTSSPSLEFVQPQFNAFAPVPEPASLLLLGIGVGALAAFRKRRLNRG